VSLPLAFAAALGELALGLGCLVAWLRSRRGSLPRRTLTVSAVVAAALLLYLLLHGPERATCGCFGSTVRASHGRRVLVAGTLTLMSSALLSRALTSMPVLADADSLGG
jgi:hypothetical protein